MNINFLSDTVEKKWFHQSIESLKRDSSLSPKNIERIIADRIAEYVVGTIGILEFLDFVDALENSQANLTPDLKFMIEDLSKLRQHKSDKQFIHAILIDVLRKITKT